MSALRFHAPQDAYSPAAAASRGIMGLWRLMGFCLVASNPSVPGMKDVVYVCVCGHDFKRSAGPLKPCKVRRRNHVMLEFDDLDHPGTKS